MFYSFSISMNVTIKSKILSGFLNFYSVKADMKNNIYLHTVYIFRYDIHSTSGCIFYLSIFLSLFLPLNTLSNFLYIFTFWYVTNWFENLATHLFIFSMFWISGGLFEDRNKGVEIAFRHTTEKINLRGDVLGKSLLIYNIAPVSQDDSFESSKKGIICIFLYIP